MFKTCGSIHMEFDHTHTKTSTRFPQAVVRKKVRGGEKIRGDRRVVCSEMKYDPSTGSWTICAKPLAPGACSEKNKLSPTELARCVTCRVPGGLGKFQLPC